MIPAMRRPNSSLFSVSLCLCGRSKPIQNPKSKIQDTCSLVTRHLYNRNPPVPHQKSTSSRPESCQFWNRKSPVPDQKVASSPQFCQTFKDLHENWWERSSRDKTACAAQSGQSAPQRAQADVSSSFSPVVQRLLQCLQDLTGRCSLTL